MKKEQIKNLLTDIRFWIILFFVLRLIGITNAPLEIGHNWRQSLTNMIARNFLEVDSNIFYPRIDMAGNATGIIGSEFPFYNYIIYLLSEIFGYAHWYGRLINLIVSSAGVYFFCKLTEKICNKQTAFNAAMILLASIWFAFSRKIMPDTFSVSLVIIGLYYGYSFIIGGTKFKLLLFFLLITTGMLCKIPALSLVSVIAVLLLVREMPLTRKLCIFGLTTISVGIVSLWYFYWVPYLVSTYKFPLYFPKGLVEGLKEILPLWRNLLEKFLFSSLSSYVALAAFVAGLFFMIKSDKKYLKMGLAIITITFFIFIIKTGAVFPMHNYYIIPFTPVMALIAGYGLLKLSGKYQYIILAFICIEGIANQQHDFFVPKSEQYKLTLEKAVDINVDKNDLIIINGGQSPQEIYFAHRKGWSVDNEMINKKSLEGYRNAGASHLILNTKTFAEKIDYVPKVYSGDNYDIYVLKE